MQGLQSGWPVDRTYEAEAKIYGATFPTKTSGLMYLVSLVVAFVAESEISPQERICGNKAVQTRNVSCT